MPGSVDAVLTGGQPTPARSETAGYDMDELTLLRAELNRILDRIQEIQKRR